MSWLAKPTKNHFCWDFPGGPVVKNPYGNARYVGSIPDGGTKIPHAVEQLSQHTAISEAWHHLEGPCASESPHGATKVLHAANKT